MDQGLPPQANEYIGDINFENYVLIRRGYNTITYVHKRYMTKNKDKNNTSDKPIQERSEVPSEDKKDKIKKRKWKLTSKGKQKQKLANAKSEDEMNDIIKSELQETTKFTRNVIPLLIPSSFKQESPTKLLYTIKTCKSNRKHKNEHSVGENAMVSQKTKRKDRTETYRKRPVKVENDILSSAKESITSRSNTLDDLRINHNLSCSLSEISGKKVPKLDIKPNENGQSFDKITVSHSFEALATEMTDNEHARKKIKIHLMNDRERQGLCQSIQEPIIRAVRDIVADVVSSRQDFTNEIKHIQRSVMSNTQKLNAVLDKLVNIENKIDLLESRKIDILNDKTLKVIKSPKSRKMKPSKLEELSEDVECRDETSSEEILHQEYLDQKQYFERKNSKSAVVLSPLRSEAVESEEVVHVSNWDNTNNNVFNIGQGEEPLMPFVSSSSGHVATQDRPNRVPARFCWTDTTKRRI